MGHEVTACENAETALEAYQQRFYPLIILDLGLPCMDGLEFCRRIRALPQGDRSMILVITAYDQQEALKAALDAEVDDYLIKPVSAEQLQIRLTIIEQRLYRLTEHKQAEEAYEVLTEKSLQGLVLLQENRIVFLNEAFAQMHGYTREELWHLPANQFFEKLVHPDDLAVVMDRARRRIQDEEVPDLYQFRIVRRDQEVRWIEVHVSLIVYQGRPAIQVAALDITERRQRELELECERKLLRAQLQNAAKSRYRFGEIIGKSPAMQEVYESISNAER